MFFVKSLKFWSYFFLRKTSLEKVFGDVLFGKKAILGEKNVD